MRRLATICLFAAALFLILNLNNFCFTRLRFVSDEELLRITVADLLARERGEIVYRSAEDLLRRNPDCCSVSGSIIQAPGIARSEDWLNWLWHRRQVHVRYRIRDTNSPAAPAFYEAYSFRDNCGTDLDAYGIEVESASLLRRATPC
ncbi:MAG: hypothetical protein AB7J28_02250 [Hyphomonadaceae bacterium]